MWTYERCECEYGGFTALGQGPGADDRDVLCSDCLGTEYKPKRADMLDKLAGLEMFRTKRACLDYLIETG